MFMIDKRAIAITCKSSLDAEQKVDPAEEQNKAKAVVDRIVE